MRRYNTSPQKMSHEDRCKIIGSSFGKVMSLGTRRNSAEQWIISSDNPGNALQLGAHTRQ